MAALNELYERMWVYYNLFQPVLHLAEKAYLQEEGKMRRRWDEARTPYERLKRSGSLPKEREEQLDELYRQTNPRALRHEIYRRLAQIWKWQAGQDCSHVGEVEGVGGLGVEQVA